MHERIHLIALAASILCANSIHAQENNKPSPKNPSMQPMVSQMKNLVASANGGLIIYRTGQVDDALWPAENLIDGKTWDPQTQKGSNGWASKGAFYPQDLIFGFRNGASKFIHKIAINPSTPDPILLGRWVKGFELWVSTTNSKPGAFKKVLVDKVENRRSRQEFLFAPIEARFVMIRITSNHGSDRYVALGEFEVYETIVSLLSIDQMIVQVERLLADLKNLRQNIIAMGRLIPEPPQMNEQEANGETSSIQSNTPEER